MNSFLRHPAAGRTSARRGADLSRHPAEGRTSPRRAVRQARRPWLAALLVPVLALSAAVAYAAWRASIPVSDKVITAGDLGVTLGSLTWDSPEQSATGDGSGLANFVIAPGQTLVLHQQIEPHVVGANLRASLGVTFPALPNGVVASWHLEADGLQVEPASGDVPIGQSVILPDSGTDSTVWSVVVTLTLPAGDPLWVDPTAQPTPQPQSLNLGIMVVEAKQVRCGDGFAVACSGTG